MPPRFSSKWPGNFSGRGAAISCPRPRNWPRFRSSRKPFMAAFLEVPPRPATGTATSDPCFLLHRQKSFLDPREGRKFPPPFPGSTWRQYGATRRPRRDALSGVRPHTRMPRWKRYRSTLGGRRKWAARSLLVHHERSGPRSAVIVSWGTNRSGLREAPPVSPSRTHSIRSDSRRLKATTVIQVPSREEATSNRRAMLWVWSPLRDDFQRGHGLDRRAR